MTEDATIVSTSGGYLKTSPAPALSTEANTPSDVSVCSEELNQGSEDSSEIMSEMQRNNSVQSMDGSPRSGTLEPLTFQFADRATVPAFLGTNVQQEIISQILDVKPDKILLITDHTVESMHGEYFAPLNSSPEGPSVEKFLLPTGDACKSWDNLSDLMRWAFDVGTTKKSLIVAFGGGALLNVSGLFASILYRGTKLIYVPTTFLAMHDVTTSLKTSICYDGRKNNIGSFYAPLKILMDVAFCRTLPTNELLSGIGELAKNAALLGGKHAEGFRAAFSKESNGKEFALDDPTLQKLLGLGIQAKMDMLLHDAYEKTSAMIFEYGHTVSHALEKAYGDGTVPHGIGVTYGMLSSSYAAVKMGYMSEEARIEHDEMCWLLLRWWPFPEPKPSIERIMGFAMRDSKRGITSEADDEISDVLLREIGDVLPTKTQMLSKFPNKYIHEWLADMGFPSK